jgi:NAD(P)-dependent dehydrogenase (short-subunit alcohol dehydrogenase family)
MELPEPEASELSGRRALVTGAESGIGQAIAQALAARGAALVLQGLDQERLRAQAEALGAELCDASSSSQLQAAAQGVDVLVHNASRFAVDDSAFLPGLEAVAELDRLALLGMTARGFGRLIYVGSHAGGSGALGLASYSASKAGLVGLMKSAALEGAQHGVTANLLELGLVDTEAAHAALSEEELARIVARTPSGRMGRAEEVGEAAAFLASPRASYITGAVLAVSGGLGLGLFPEQLG